MIRHTVVFTLKYSQGDPEEKEFFKAAMKLSSIPGVNHFEYLRQTSKKNSFEYCISMEFDTHKAYEEYNQHSEHVAFVKIFWMRDVVDFMEIDVEPIT